MVEKSLFELLKRIIEKSTLAAVSATSSGEGITLSNGVITQVQINTLAVARGTDTDFTLSNGGVKCNFDGYIEVCGSVYVSAGSGTYAEGCYIYKNSAEVTSMLLRPNSYKYSTPQRMFRSLRKHTQNHIPRCIRRSCT